MPFWTSLKLMLVFSTAACMPAVYYNHLLLDFAGLHHICENLFRLVIRLYLFTTGLC